MLTSLMVSLVPAVSASHITQYAVQRDPSHLSLGDLDCDGHNDIVAVSMMGHFITVLYNDGSGGFQDRQDVFISNNDSQRAGFVDTANSVDVEIADIDGDDVNDIIYYQENIRFVGESFVRPGNLTIMWGDCSERVNQWDDTEITVSNPYHRGMAVGDIDDDGNVDIVLVTQDATAANQYIQIYRGPDPSLLTNQQSIPVPLTNGLYVEMMLGHWGETVQGGGIPGGLGDCEDLDIWLLRTPPYNMGGGYSGGHYDNMPVLEYACLTNQYPNPMDATAQGIHEFKLDADHNYPLYGIDIADTDDDNEIDLIAAIDGITGNISYATKSGSSWDTQNYVYLGDYLGASLTIVDVNQDGEVDFFVPTEVTLTRLQDSTAQNQTYLLLDNLREINSVEIILADPNGPGYLSSLSFDVGRRPTMAIPGQLQGGDESAYEIVIGQRDYGYRFADNAMWLDTQGWAGAGDFLSVLTLDNEDVGITEVTIAPASYNPATGQAEIGEGTRWVNVTVKNTGLNPLTGSVDVDLEVKEVVGGTDTVVYSNDFEGNEDTTNCANCAFIKNSYTGMYGTGASSWHIESNSTADTQNVSWYEADSNPTDYYWAGIDYNGDNESDSGYYNNMDEALILENVDLTGADAAYMDLSVMCTTAYFELYLAEQYSVVERWLYEDSCGIEVWSEGNGWESVFFNGGWDNERFFRIYWQGVDPEYNTYNGNQYTNTATGWINYTEGGGTSEDPNELESIDLTRYAGQVIDIRFRFRSGLMGSVGPAGSSQDTGLDGFAFDNITIRKRDVTFGTTETVSQQLIFNGFAAGAYEEVSLTADFIDNRTYYVKTELTNPSGFTNMDDLNDDIRFQLTVNNLFDPCLAEEHWVDLENGVRYASGERDVEVRVQNCGNTVTDFQVEAFIQNAEPDLIAIEDFSGVEPMWTDDGNLNGSRLDDSTGSNDMLPQNRGVFNSHAYWLGHPTDGYGDDWNETVTLDPIPVASTGADFTYLTFDYYAEGDYLKDNNGNILAIRDAANLEISWNKQGEVFEGVVYGTWTDLNENGIQNTIPGDPNFHRCEDFDNNGYDEVEYFGDHSDNVNSVVWFDSENILKSVTVDLTHIVILNRTSADTSDWRDECTTLSGSEVTLTWRFQSNDDGVNGNAGLAGFGVDNIRVEEFTFEDDGTYTVDVTGLDAAERQRVNLTTHDFQSGIYKIDVTTIFDNTDPLTSWYNESETNTANNHSSIIFSIASADITLLQPDVLECVADITYECVYPIDDASAHSFAVPLLNGVIAGEYEITMRVVDLGTGQTVYEEDSDNGPFDLEPHARAQANWTSPYNSWYDGHTYNISFYGILTEDNEPSGNDRYFDIQFYDNIDVAILSNPTDQNRLQSVKKDLEAMGKTYTQLRLENWDTYGTPDWVEHFDKVLLPWQTDYNVYYGEYYEALAETRESDGLSLTETLEDYMTGGGTVQMHLGPYRNEYQPNRLPFGIDIAMRNQVNFTVDNRIHYSNLSIIDRYHPILSNVDPIAFSGVHGGSYVALAGLDTAQVQSTQIPQVCGGRISDPIGTFHTLIRDSVYDSQSLLSICNRGAGGLIVTTIDVENPSVSEGLGGSSIPLLSNMLSYHLTPYPSDFGIAGESFDLTINGEAPSIDTVTGAYATMYIKSNSDLDFSYVTSVEGVFADWTLESGNNDSVTGWDGSIIDSGEYSHTQQLSPSIPTLGSFCVGDTTSNTGCRIGAEWMLVLYLHDDEGHTRITYIRMVTDDTLADEFRPIASASMIENTVTDTYVTLDGTKTVAGVDWPVYRARLSDTGDLSISFTAQDSYDPDAPEGEKGIELYEWKVFFDYPWDSADPTLVGHEFQIPFAAGDDWTYVFRNLTSSPDGNLENQIRVELIVYDKAGKQSEKARMYFIVVGEDFGDDEPVVDLSKPRPEDSQSENLVTISGSLLSGAENSDVVIEVALTEAVLDYTTTQKITQKSIGKYNKTENLADGQPFTLTLDISDLYQETGVAATIYVLITEGDGSRYTISQTLAINLLPIVPDEPDEKEGGMSMLLMGGLAAFILILVVVVTVVMRGRGKEDPGDDVVEQFGGVEEMDPVEAYVQQMVASGYDEQTARQYAQQYYAQYYEQQRRGGS
jgi:hypothetical protein